MNKRLALSISIIIGLAAAVFFFKRYGLGEALVMMIGAPFKLIIGYLTITCLIILTLVLRWRNSSYVYSVGGLHQLHEIENQLTLVPQSSEHD